jgi:hypothetical protein
VYPLARSRAFSYWDEAKHNWTIDPGKFVILVGDSSENTPLHALPHHQLELAAQSALNGHGFSRAVNGTKWSALAAEGRTFN